jgi:hypothetical protein
MPDSTTTADMIEVKGKVFAIEHVILDDDTFYGCGILPLRRNRDDLIGDITRAQGPEWRK